MEPGQPVLAEIVRAFGPEVVGPDGRLNRARLADFAFRQGRLQELNAIVHPPVIEAQARWMHEVFVHDPSAVAVIESALIFEVVRDARARGESDGVLTDWRRRMDRVIVVTAPDELKIRRYAARIQASSSGSGVSLEALEADARNRLAYQVTDAEKIAEADYVLDNSGDVESLSTQVETLWPRLLQANIAESNKFGQ
jgi:dephospho-CoA kinase